MDRFNCTQNFNRVFLVEFDEFILKSTRKNNEIASMFLKINNLKEEGIYLITKQQNVI